MEEDKPQILLWTAPECPYRVTIPAAVLNEIRILAIEAFYSVPRGGVEVGGVFFGVREPHAIHIQAHRPIRCEYATGPSFTLSVKDQLGLSGLFDQAHADPDLAGMASLGWYHSHTRSGLLLSPADLEIYNEFFHERWQVALVLQPANLQPTRAGFFFRDRWGSLKSDAPVQEFKLEPPNFGLACLDPHDAIAVPQQVPAAPIAPPVKVPEEAPAVQPSIETLPAARSLPSGGSAAASALALALATASETAPSPPAAPSAAPIPAAPLNGSGAIASVVSDTRTPDVAPEPAPKPEPEKSVEPGIHSFNLAELETRDNRNAGWIWALVIILLLAGGASAAFLKWGRIARPVDLGLETYDINGAFLIRWDRGSASILGATHATLEIDDGGEKIPIDLSPGELAFGGYGYLRRTAQVSVHMKVDGPTPVEEYSNFKGVQAPGSPPAQSPEASHDLARALEEKAHLKTELINESMLSAELRKEVASLRRQLAEERAKNVSKRGR